MGSNAPTFFDLLPTIALLAGRPELVDEFRRKYREEICGLLMMLQRIGLSGDATSLHPCPPKQCDLCRINLLERQWFVDGETSEGSWSNMCPACFYKSGRSVGWGHGQLYRRLEGGSWRLISGGDPTALESSA